MLKSHESLNTFLSSNCNNERDIKKSMKIDPFRVIKLTLKGRKGAKSHIPRYKYSQRKIQLRFFKISGNNFVDTLHIQNMRNSMS